MSEQPPSGNRWEPNDPSHEPASPESDADAGSHERAESAPAAGAPDERTTRTPRSGNEKGLLAGIAAVLLAAGLGGGWAIGSATGADAEGQGHHGAGPGGLPGGGEWQPPAGGPGQPAGGDGDHHGFGPDDGPDGRRGSEGGGGGAGSQTDAS